MEMMSVRVLDSYTKKVVKNRKKFTDYNKAFSYIDKLLENLQTNEFIKITWFSDTYFSKYGELYKDETLKENLETAKIFSKKWFSAD